MGIITRIFGQHDENTLQQLKDVASRAEIAALMSDGHAGYVMPIGGVAGYENKVSPVGVGFDIGCGNAAIRTNLRLEDLCGITVEEFKANPHSVAANRVMQELADTIAANISFGVGRRNDSDDAPVDDPLFHDPAWYAIPQKIPTDVRTGYRDALREKAQQQLGTVGSGNHYVDVFVDDEGWIWVGVHFGSRGFGHTVASAFLALSQGGNWGDKAKEVEVLLDLAQPIGHDYWALMELAGRYAYAGREWVARKVVSILGGIEQELIHNHHNFAWKERQYVPDDRGYEPRELVVVRKGATPAFPGQLGFVGGSMGDDSVILRGADTIALEESHQITSQQALDTIYDQTHALFSTVHGAGRVMSRTQAAGKRYRNGKKRGQYKKDANGNVINAGLISGPMMNGWIKNKGVILRGGGRDEAPQAYRRLTNVLEAQGSTIEVLRTLSPVIVCMAGENEYDPYKD